MAALSDNNPTLLDIAKMSDPNGKVTMQIVEILNETNEILDDMVWVEGNLPTGHRTTLRTGIPAPTWRQFNQGVQPSKGRTAQVTFNCGMMENFSEIDVALAELNGNAGATRVSQDRAILEGFNQEMSDTLFYGNEGTEPAAFTGLTPYYNSLSGVNAENVITGGGSANCQSIWLVGWGEQKIRGILPKGSKAGFQMTDLGKCVIENADGAGGRMLAYRTHYRWDAGLAVEDWRYAVRIPNIDTSLLTSVYTSGAFSTGAHLPNLVFQAIRQLPSLANCRPVLYMSRGVLTKFMQQCAAATQNSTLMSENVGGKIITTYQGVPIRRVDALATSETTVA